MFQATWPSGLRRRSAKPLFGGSNPPVASISTQTEEAPEKSGAFSRLTANLTATGNRIALWELCDQGVGRTDSRENAARLAIDAASVTWATPATRDLLF